jgi:type II secretory pathway pseudopilin PulG
MRTSARVGFTLLELLFAMLLTAVAVTLAASTLRSASIAKERVTVHRTTLERESRLRAVLTDMLRHAPSAELVEEPLMQLDTPAPDDSRLIFLSKGVRAPFGTGPTWRVSVSASDSGLTLDAEPIGAAQNQTRLHTIVPNVTGLDVQLLERTTSTSRGAWRNDWPLAQVRPAMIALRFREARANAPLVVSLDPLALIAERR